MMGGVDQFGAAAPAAGFYLILHRQQFAAAGFQVFELALVFPVDDLQGADLDFHKIEQVFNRLLG
jgi:hypothetical protein